MDTTKYDDLRVGQNILVRHEYHKRGPMEPYAREWVGKVTVANQKWLRVKRDGYDVVVPQISEVTGAEQIFILDKKESKEYGI